MDNNTLTPNELAFIALTNEYCHLMERAPELTRDDFLQQVAKLLPRIYITALDLGEPLTPPDAFMSQALDENTYDVLRGALSAVLGEDDVYLEVFVEDMKYSDTPVSAFISENLADLYQEFYNLVSSLEDLTAEAQRELLAVCREDFKEFWSQTLCNVLRAVNSVLWTPDDY